VRTPPPLRSASDRSPECQRYDQLLAECPDACTSKQFDTGTLERLGTAAGEALPPEPVDWRACH
ncbi:hypothetical protein, partial [Corallococcus terminator]|uniref:hypothetical protein n=1 Tax=Corallococcus terminator TaxID=2316733 RepID=UPI0013153D6F